MAQGSLSKRERLERTIHGETADRAPVALWRHFPVDDQDPAGLAVSTAAFQREHDFDFVKVTPASSFCVKDWGADDQWRGNPEGTRDYTHRPIHSPDDWAGLKRLDPRRGRLGDQLRSLEILREALARDSEGAAGPSFARDVPFIQTIFSPLSQARNLAGGWRPSAAFMPAGGEHLAVHLRRWPDALKAALDTITATTVDFVQAARATGIAGIFYAQQYASHRLLSGAEYREFARPYDLRVLEAAGGLWLNVLHLHGDDIMFDAAADYPVAVVNWHDRETPPSLGEGMQKIKGAVCGGVRQIETLVLGTPDDIRREAADALAQTAGRRFILGTGCVTPTNTPLGNIRAVRNFVET